MHRNTFNLIVSFTVLFLWSTAAHALPIFVDQTATYHYVNATAATDIGAVSSNWFTPGFNDSSWFVGNGPFSSTTPSSTIFNQGNSNGPYAPDPTQPIPSTFTSWTVNYDPYLRTSFTLSAPTALTVWIGVDNGINSLYLNGVLATAAVNAEGNAFRWESVFDVPAAYTLAGPNILALQLEDHGGLTGFVMMVTADDAAINTPITTNPPMTSVPEPATLLLLASGVASLAALRRKLKS
jgi:hypothetical protein